MFKYYRVDGNLPLDLHPHQKPDPEGKVLKRVNFLLAYKIMVKRNYSSEPLTCTFIPGDVISSHTMTIMLILRA